MNKNKQTKQKSISWWIVILFLPARFVFAFLVQGVVALVLLLNGSTTPWQDAASWWLIFSTLTDILSLLALSILLRFEGLGLGNAFKQNLQRPLSQLKYIPLFILLLTPFVVVANIITSYFYGSTLPPMIEIVDLPMWGVVYSVLVWPIIWVIAEQLVYLGYLLPRLEALFGKTWLAGVLVAFFWGVQHFAVPFIPDTNYLVSRVLAALAVSGGFTLIYLYLKRPLFAAIVVHWLADTSTAIIASLSHFS